MKQGVFFWAAALTAAALLVAACGTKPAAKSAPAVYSVQGTIVEIHPEDLQVVIDAQAIPNFMDAMTMPYSVKDAALLKGLKPGESVSFDLAVTPDGDYIQSIAPAQKSKPAKAASESRTPKPDNAAFIHIPHAGDVVPDLALIDQDGRPWRITDEHGKVAAMTFIYASCPLKAFCPRSMNEFALLKRELGPLLGRRVDLFAVSFDAKRDTPEVLKRYGENFGAGGPSWRLLTGRPENVEKFVSFFDVNYWSGPDGEITDHSLSTAIIGTDGRVAHFEAGNRFTGKELAGLIRKILQSSGGAS